MKDNDPKNPIVSATIVRCHNGLDGKPVLEPTQYHFDTQTAHIRGQDTPKQLSIYDTLNISRAAQKRSRRASQRVKGALT